MLLAEQSGLSHGGGQQRVVPNWTVTTSLGANRGWWDLERENLQLNVEIIEPLTVNPHPPSSLGGVPFLAGLGGVVGGGGSSSAKRGGVSSSAKILLGRCRHHRSHPHRLYVGVPFLAAGGITDLTVNPTPSSSHRSPVPHRLGGGGPEAIFFRPIEILAIVNSPPSSFGRSPVPGRRGEPRGLRARARH